MIKKIIVLIVIIVGILFIMPSKPLAESITQDDIIQNQQESLNISNFINEAKKYSNNVFEDVDFNELFKSAISRKLR